MTLRGDWNGNIYAKKSHENEFHFSDVRAKPEIKKVNLDLFIYILKECVPVAEQNDRESRRLWRHVTAALYHDNIDVASSAKRFIEQRQRNEAKIRKENGTEPWLSQFFDKTNDSWIYKHPLDERLEKQ